MSTPRYPKEHLLAEIERRQRTRVCIVKGCYGTIDGLGPYCSKHRSKFRTTGHPLGLSVTNTQFKRWREVITRPWLDHQLGADHVDAVHAVANMDKLLRNGATPSHYGKHLSLDQRVRYWFGRLFAAGTDGRDLLEGFVGLHALSIYDPRVFPDGLSGRHFRIQASGRLMGLPASKLRRISGHLPPNREPFKVREELFRRVNYRIGQFARRAGQAVVETMPDYQPRFDSGKAFAPPPGK